MRSKAGLCVFFLFASAQYPGQVNKPVKATAISARATIPAFTDVATTSGITFRHQGSHTSQKYMIERMDAGVAFLDYDGDGLLDLYFVNGARVRSYAARSRARRVRSALLESPVPNTGSGTFLDVTEKAHVRGQEYGMGVAVADYDNDGHPDLYVTSLGRNALYRNRGDGTFEDATDKAGVGAEGWSTGPRFWIMTATACSIL